MATQDIDNPLQFLAVSYRFLPLLAVSCRFLPFLALFVAVSCRFLPFLATFPVSSNILKFLIIYSYFFLSSDLRDSVVPRFA